MKIEIKNTVTVGELAEKIANIYNNRTAVWDFQHNGQSRYEGIEEMTDKLESTLFEPNDIRFAIEREAENVEYMNDVMSLDEWAEFVADPVAQRITKNQYQDVTFTITLKK